MEKEAIEKLAELARLELPPEEIEEYRGQIGSILEYVRKLEELDLPPDAPQMAHAVEMVDPWRDDVPRPVSDQDRAALIAAFPEMKGNMNVVPVILKQDEPEL